jgi:general secretion pathway protein K
MNIEHRSSYISLPATLDVRRSSRGSALIVTLWVIALLSVFVGELAFEAHIEARITSYYRKRVKAEHLARSGVEVARMLMIRSQQIVQDAEPEEDDRWFEDAKQLKEGAAVTITEPAGDGKLVLTIVSERARRNVNLLQTEKEWESVLKVGGVPEEMWPRLIDPVLDWMDPDNVPRPGDGAETEDTYAVLDPPMRAKNGPLDTVGELLLVKGFSPAILYGGLLDTGFSGTEPVPVSGIADLLTVYGGEQLNVNAASRRVLMTIPGIDELVAGAVEEERAGYEGKAATGSLRPGKSVVFARK